MIITKETDYKICLLDTNILSTIIKGKDINVLENYYSLQKQGYIGGISISTLGEISKKDWLIEYFEKFINLGNKIIIFKPSNEIAKIELEEYPNIINKNKLFFDFINSSTQILPNSHIIYALKSKKFRGTQNLLKIEVEKTAKRIIKEIGISIKEYKKDKQSRYIKRLILSHINTNKKINFEINDNNILSYKIIYISLLFYYLERNKKVELNDMIDYLILTILPYCNMALLDKNMFKTIRMIKNQFNFLDNIQIGYINNLKQLEFE